MKLPSPAIPVVLLTFLCCAFGCAEQVPSNRGNLEVDTDTPSRPSAITDSDATAQNAKSSTVDAQLASWQDLQEWVADQRGKVVVVDVWSTYCPECMTAFPQFLALQQQLQEHVTCASLSVDYYGGEGDLAETVKPRVVEFLKSQQAATRNFIANQPDAQILEKISTAAIPAVLVFDQQGQLEKVFNNDQNTYGPKGFTYQDDVTPFVRSLIANQ